MLSERQRSLLRHWLLMVAVCELAMVVWRDHLASIYLMIAALFLGGFLLRIGKVYPGKTEPLVLDGSAVGISLVYAVVASLTATARWRGLLIFTSSLIICPHLFYILGREDP